jgi:hypothetical protein
VIARLPISAVAVVVLAVTLAACGESATTSDNHSATKAAENTATNVARPRASEPKKTVMRCLRNLDSPENRGGGVWVAYTSDGDLIRVKRLDSASDAKSAVKAATEVQGAAGGPYVVFGPLGSGLTVKPLASCLRNVGGAS